MSLPPPDRAGAALVTGASSGLGAELARALAARRHQVVLVARREERLQALATDLRARHGVRAEVLPCDLTDAAARAALPDRVGALGLRVDVLVNNAGFATGGPFHASDLEQELDQVRLLCEAPVDLTGRLLPGMVSRRAGAILNVASIAGMLPLPNSAGYAAAKAYLLSFSQAVHAEARPHGVTVTALCPGPVRTELFAKVDHPVERMPGPTWSEAGEVASAALDGLERGRRLVMPGVVAQAARPFSTVLPRALQLPLFERFFR